MFTTLPVFLFTIISYVLSQLPVLRFIPLPPNLARFHAPLLEMLFSDAVKLLAAMVDPFPPLVCIPSCACAVGGSLQTAGAENALPRLIPVFGAIHISCNAI